MVKQSDRAPLLDWEEIPPADASQAAQQQQQQHPPLPPSREEKVAPKSSQPPGRRPAAVTVAGTGWSAAVTRGPESSATAADRSGNGSPGRPRAEPPGPGRGALFPGLSSRGQWEEKDQIVAVFVVTFGTRSGEQTSVSRGIFCLPSF